MTQIAILDYGMGNLRSVEKALERVGAEATITADPQAVRAADGVILPGVGAFPAAMRRVRELELDALVAERLSAGTPVLGICLGLQLLLDRSSEQGGEEGLGLMPGEVTELEAPGLKLPHIGWEPVRWERPSELTEGLETETPFYFVHSFGVRPSDGADVLGTAAVGRALRVRRRPPAALRGPVSPREVERRRPAPAGELHRDLRLRARLSVILYPGDRHPGRARRSAGARRVRPRDRLRRGPRGRRPPLGRAGGALPARRGPRRGALRRAPEPRAREADRERGQRPDSGRGRSARRLDRDRGARRRGRAGGARHGDARPPRARRGARRRARGADRRRRRRSLGPSRDRGLGA